MISQVRAYLATCRPRTRSEWALWALAAPIVGYALAVVIGAVVAAV